MNGVGRALVSVLLLATVGCSDSYEPPETDTVEIFSWWTSGGEVQALDAVLELHKQTHPNTNILNIAQEGGGQNAQERLEQRIRDDYPPEIFQSNFGHGSLRNWLEFNGADKPSIQPLNSLFEEQGWTATYSDLLRDSVSIDGQIYAVPVNVHRTNSLFYNKAVFDEIGMDPPTTLEEFYAVGDALLALDPPIVPLAIGSEGAWTVNLLMMENLLVAMAGPDFYMSYFSGQETPDHPNMVAMLEEMLVIWDGYVNEDANMLQWDAAVQMVADGDAAMTIMGDWAKGYLLNKGLVPGEDFGQVPSFGSDGAFVFTGDCFPMAVAAENVSGGMELLKTFGSKEAQDLFNPLKGSIPARIDADLSTYDDLARANYDAFSDPAVMRIPSLSALIPSEVGSALVNAIPAMLDSGDPASMLEALAENYDVLGQ